MKIGMRFKLVALLVVVALLPLLAATATIVIGLRRTRVEAFGQRLESAATIQAQSMRAILSKDIEKLMVQLNTPLVGSDIARIEPNLTPQQAQDIEKAWPSVDANSSVLKRALGNSVVRVLERIRHEDPRFNELSVTDSRGNLVAATAKPDDFYAGDQEWWKKAYNGGMGMVYSPQIEYDASSKAWTLNLCLPIFAQGKIAGVARAEMDITKWIGTHTIDMGEFPASVMLLRDDGRILFRPGIQSLSKTISGWSPRLLRHQWRVSEDEIQAFAPMDIGTRIGGFPAESPMWMLVLYLPRSKPMEAVSELALRTLVGGLLIIGLIFLAGLYLVDRSIVRRLLRLVQATHKVAEGDLAHRVGHHWSRRRLLGGDEIDSLAADFDRMIERVQQSHEALQNANELKARFINIASHELRTPVSYIMGMSRLLRDNHDSDKLLFAVQSMGSKAKRLDEIIQAMFKLLPGQTYRQEMHYSRVPVSELLEEIYLDCFPFIEKRSQRLIIKLGEGTPDIQADRDKIRDVIENLVINAIKFTPDGGEVKVSAGPELSGRLTISVHDQGPGIPQRDLPHIFEPFYAGGEVLQHSSGGSEYQKQGMGLGLAIVRSFVQMHGGSVSVASTPSGCTFTVTLPIEAPAPTSRPLAPPEQ